MNRLLYILGVLLFALYYFILVFKDIYDTQSFHHNSYT
jgi:hypothetical protein